MCRVALAAALRQRVSAAAPKWGPFSGPEKGPKAASPNCWGSGFWGLSRSENGREIGPSLWFRSGVCVHEERVFFASGLPYFFCHACNSATRLRVSCRVVMRAACRTVRLPRLPPLATASSCALCKSCVRTVGGDAMGAAVRCEGYRSTFSGAVSLLCILLSLIHI